MAWKKAAVSPEISIGAYDRDFGVQGDQTAEKGFGALGFFGDFGFQREWDGHPGTCARNDPTRENSPSVRAESAFDLGLHLLGGHR